jgi:hypothetical protein
VRVVLAALVLAAAGCGTAPTSVVATFEVEGERFRVHVTNAQTISALQKLARGEAGPSIPNGRIVAGKGNEPWSWRLEDIELADVTMELCDGRPSYVEENLDEYLRIGRYCPWGARVISVVSGALASAR